MIKRVLVLLILLASAATASACNIPVFRYALERWRPDACEIVVSSATAISEPHQQMLKGITSSSKHINLVLKQIADKAPMATVRCKVSDGQKVNVWHGPLDDLPNLGLTKSPARDELSRRLLKGDSVVWLMIGTTDKEKNKAARKKLETQFGSLTEKIALPEGIGLPGSELFSDVPLLLQFSLLEIDPSDAKETFLIKLLTGIQAEAFDEGEPLFIPVFGRGRALEVIPESDLSERLVEDLTVFLSGACSCQVKERNPGFDLLIATDWDTELFGEDGEVPDDKPQRQKQGGKPRLLTIPPGKESLKKLQD